CYELKNKRRMNTMTLAITRIQPVLYIQPVSSQKCIHQLFFKRAYKSQRKANTVIKILIESAIL
ncbi:hypothetical protein ACO1MN_16885, partial [Staphylococcus aureus]